jgi:thiol-disulfide isomerase/thioredoxin
LKTATIRSLSISVVALMLGSLVMGLAGCSADPLAEQFRQGDNKNYIAGDGTITEFASVSRPTYEEFSGITESGAQLESSALAGSVVVMNWWYASCAPCRAEAPELAELSAEFSNQGVQFLGVNVRDTAETALAFDRKFGIDFPSIIDAQSGSVSLAFTGVVSPAAVPTTIVIGRDGKITARILGKIDKSILRTLIQTAIDQ